MVLGKFPSLSEPCSPGSNSSSTLRRAAEMKGKDQQLWGLVGPHWTPPPAFSGSAHGPRSAGRLWHVGDSPLWLA